MLGPLGFSLLVDRHAGTPGMTVLPEAGFRRARAAIAGWPGYAPTPLRDLPAIARASRPARPAHRRIGSLREIRISHSATTRAAPSQADPAHPGLAAPDIRA
jgi:hypothetical protein